MAEQQTGVSRASRVGIGLGLGAGSSAVLGYVVLVAFGGVAGAAALLVSLPALSHTSFGRTLLSSVAHVSVGPALPSLSFDVSSISARLGGGARSGGAGGASGSGGGFGAAGSGSYASGGSGFGSGSGASGSGGFVPGSPPVGAPGSGDSAGAGSAGPSAGKGGSAGSSGAGSASGGVPGSSSAVQTDLIPPGVPVHSERVSASYGVALSAATSTFLAFENDNLDNLVPLLNTIYTQAAAGDYTTILTEMDQARGIIAQERGTLSSFGTALSGLSAAAAGAPASVLSSTSALAASGGSLNAAANAYLDTLSGALSGSLPSQATLDAISAKVNALAAANDAFKQALANVVLALNALPS